MEPYGKQLQCTSPNTGCQYYSSQSFAASNTPLWGPLEGCLPVIMNYGMPDCVGVLQKGQGFTKDKYESNSSFFGVHTRLLR